ncbi:MAG: hypothetical protein YYHSYBAR_001867 [Candidatus Fervidibacter sacchari]
MPSRNDGEWRVVIFGGSGSCPTAKFLLISKPSKNLSGVGQKVSDKVSVKGSIGACPRRMLNDHRSQGETLQAVFSFNCRLTTTNLSHNPQRPTLFATEVAPTAG